MGPEKRTIQATAYTGITDIIIGLIMMITGWHTWYYEHFHFFGVLGLSFITYYLWHRHLYKQDTGKSIWENTKRKY